MAFSLANGIREHKDYGNLFHCSEISTYFFSTAASCSMDFEFQYDPLTCNFFRLEECQRVNLELKGLCSFP